MALQILRDGLEIVEEFLASFFSGLGRCAENS
jgi:hypothetical protein